LQNYDFKEGTAGESSITSEEVVFMQEKELRGNQDVKHCFVSDEREERSWRHQRSGNGRLKTRSSQKERGCRRPSRAWKNVKTFNLWNAQTAEGEALVAPTET